MEIKVLKRYNHKADIEIDGVIYKEVYPVGVNIENAVEMKGNKIEVTINYSKNLHKKNKEK